MKSIQRHVASGKQEETPFSLNLFKVHSELSVFGALGKWRPHAEFGLLMNQTLKRCGRANQTIEFWRISYSYVISDIREHPDMMSSLEAVMDKQT